MSRLLHGAIALLVYFGFATFVAEAIVLLHLGLTGRLDGDKVARMLAVLQGVDLAADQQEAGPSAPSQAQNQVSYDAIVEARAVKIRNIELREQALREGLDVLRSEQRKLSDERKVFLALKQGFEKQLADMQQKATSEGMDDNRAKLESIKPKQAKELLMEMLAKGEMDAVVPLLRAMPQTKAGKIIAEFKTPEELEKIGEVLRRIRQGDASADLATNTQKTIEKPQASTPKPLAAQP